jgi:histidine triad (HIT) family protein
VVEIAPMDCIFCAIVAGDIPSRQIHADEHAVAFLDIQPWHRGHTLVIPRRHVVDLMTGPQALVEMAPAIEATSRLLVERLGADGLNLIGNNGTVAGQEVLHLHVHLVPRYSERPGIRRLIEPDPLAGADLDAVYAQLTGAP